MGLPTQWQIDHINEHLDAFHAHAGSDRTPAEYLAEYAYYKDGEIYERLCDDLGIEPRQGGHMSQEVSPEVRHRLEMQLTLGMEEDGSELSPQRRAEIETQLGPDYHDGLAPADEATAEVGTVQDQAGLPTDVQEFIRQEIAKAGGGPQPAAQPTNLEDVLLAIDPRDSDSALLLFQWLQATGRLNVVATLTGKGGYLLHYQEPKGSSKEGYIPGGTQGGRMVDQALETAKASGAKAKNLGMCDKCWSAVELIEETGAIVLNDETQNAVCPQGGPHTFNP